MTIPTKRNRVDFVGFTPTVEQKWLVEAEITKLLDRAPGQSSLVAIICSEAEGFSAKVRIDSFSHKFETYGSSTDLYGLMNKIDNELAVQFTKWKSERFWPQLS